MRSVILAFAFREDMSEEANLSRNLNEMRGGLTNCTKFFASITQKTM